MKTAIVMARLAYRTGTPRNQSWRRPGGRIAEALNNIEWTNFGSKAAHRSKGEIAISGSKNSALPALAACLLTDEPVRLDRIPPVRDIRTMDTAAGAYWRALGRGWRTGDRAGRDWSGRKRPMSW